MDFDYPDYMAEALDAARTAGHRDEVPIGAVIVDPERRRILAKCGNQTIGRNDPTAHAEILAIRAAAQMVGNQRLIGCDIYVTLEPCTMCAAAISFARLRRLVYGASDPKGGGIEQGARVYHHRTCHHRPEVESGVRSEEAAKLLTDFFAAKR